MIIRCVLQKFSYRRKGALASLSDYSCSKLNHITVLQISKMPFFRSIFFFFSETSWKLQYFTLALLNCQGKCCVGLFFKGQIGIVWAERAAVKVVNLSMEIWRWQGTQSVSAAQVKRPRPVRETQTLDSIVLFVVVAVFLVPVGSKHREGRHCQGLRNRRAQWSFLPTGAQTTL